MCRNWGEYIGYNGDMNRFLLVVITIGLLAWGWGTWQKQKLQPTPLPSFSSKPSAEPLLGLAKNEPDLMAFEAAGKAYRIVWHLIQPSASVQMGVNTDLASSSAGIFQEQQCQILTSGGFYASDGKPIGLLIVDGQIVSPWQRNQLFTGVLGSDGTTFEIVMGDVSSRTYTWAVQAGPVLWMNRAATTLALKNDQPARRILAGVTTDGSLVLMAVVAGDSLFGGPLLTEIDALIPVIAGIIGQEFESVINLDGGTASALISTTISLRELKPIGSYVCVK